MYVEYIYSIVYYRLLTDIPMETLDSAQLHQIRMVYYISPSRFYVYLKEKFNSHTSVNKRF